MPILQKEKTIGSVGIPARSTGGTQQKQCGQNAHTTERGKPQAVRAECPYYKKIILTEFAQKIVRIEVSDAHLDTQYAPPRLTRIKT
jgi:hypothetical protein